MNQTLALALIAAGFLLAGYLDGQDHAAAERYAASNAGQQMACIDCAGGVPTSAYESQLAKSGEELHLYAVRIPPSDYEKETLQ